MATPQQVTAQTDVEETAEQQVVIQRRPLVLRDSQTYQVPLHLDPIKTVTVVAHAEGTVNTILVKLAENVKSRSELMRLDSTERRLLRDIAKAEYTSAQASKSGEEAAKAKLDLAEYRLDQTIARAPIDGTVVKIHVVQDQYVRVGDSLVTVIDTSQLQVELPVERADAEENKKATFNVEDAEATGELIAVLPLDDRFESLRDLFLSIASGVAVLDNADGRWKAGQTVYSKLIPRDPVTEVDNASLKNTEEGVRKVQVVRKRFVRDVPVVLLGAVGAERTFVSGRFAEGDEIITSSSQELFDGTQVVQSGPSMDDAPGTNRRPGRGQSGDDSNRKPGF